MLKDCFYQPLPNHYKNIFEQYNVDCKKLVWEPAEPKYSWSPDFIVTLAIDEHSPYIDKTLLSLKKSIEKSGYLGRVILVINSRLKDTIYMVRNFAHNAKIATDIFFVDKVSKILALKLANSFFCNAGVVITISSDIYIDTNFIKHHIEELKHKDINLCSVAMAQTAIDSMPKEYLLKYMSVLRYAKLCTSIYLNLTNNFFETTEAKEFNLAITSQALKNIGEIESLDELIIKAQQYDFKIGYSIDSTAYVMDPAKIAHLVNIKKLQPIKKITEKAKIIDNLHKIWLENDNYKLKIYLKEIGLRRQNIEEALCCTHFGCLVDIVTKHSLKFKTKSLKLTALSHELTTINNEYISLCKI